LDIIKGRHSHPKNHQYSLNNTYVTDAKLGNPLLLNRRAFLVAIGAVTALVSSCSALGEKPAPDATSMEIERIVKAKNELITDAEQLAQLNPALRKPLQAVIDQNLIHIEALSSYIQTFESASANPVSANKVGLPALTTRCAVFSTNNLITAGAIPDAEISRVVALIAGSEMQHYALLSGYIS
jgi:hypothetical protein